jgi:phi13 family phage major tail protein
MGKGARIGFDQLWYAIMTDETNEVYGTPKRFPGAISAGVSPEVNSETLYADDQPDEVATALGNITIDLAVKDVPADIMQDLLGNTIDANGVLIENTNDQAPYVAVGWRSRKSNGQYRHFWYYKGRFQPSDEDYQTKEATPTFQTPSISATFVARTKDGQRRVRVDQDDAGVPASVITNWFTAVYEQNADTTAPTVTVLPANNATAVVVTAIPKWTFSKAIRSDTVNAGNFIVQKADGSAQVAGTLVLNTAATEVTFTPTANLAAATPYMLIAGVGVKDIAGNALASPSVTKFTTA